MGIEELFRDTTLSHSSSISASSTSSYRTHLCFWNLLEVFLFSIPFSAATSESVASLTDLYSEFSRLYVLLQLDRGGRVYATSLLPL